MRSFVIGCLSAILIAAPIASQANGGGSDLLAEAELMLQQHRYPEAREAVARFWSEVGDTIRGDRRARALMLRSVLSESLDEAEVDLLRISIEHPGSLGADGALLRIAQARAAQGDDDGARVHLERLLRDHPTSDLRERARDMLGRGPEVPSLARRASVPDPPMPPPPPAERDAEAITPEELTIEIGWFGVVSDAEEMRNAARAAGFPAHLARLGRSGTTVVRVGSFRDRAEAEASARRIRQAGFPAEVTSVTLH
jgi:hypothetical protein